MQKMMFLLEKQTGDEYYRFEPADYGPFSWQLSKDVDYLVASGCLTQRIRTTSEGEKYEYMLTKSGLEIVKKGLADGDWLRNQDRVLRIMLDLKQQNNRRNLRALLREVYSKYPEYAAKSRVAF